MNGIQSDTALLKALSHRARLEIVGLLRHGEVCVCHLEAHLGYRQPYISQQIMVLKKARLVSERRDGTYVYYRLIDRRVAAVLNALAPQTRIPKARAQRIRRCTCPNCVPKARGRAAQCRGC